MREVCRCLEREVQLQRRRLGISNLFLNTRSRWGSRKEYRSIHSHWERTADSSAIQGNQEISYVATGLWRYVSRQCIRPKIVRVCQRSFISRVTNLSGWNWLPAGTRYGYPAFPGTPVQITCTWRHGGHVGVQNNSEKSPFIWEFDFIIMLNLSDILPLFWTPICLPHHVSETQEMTSRFCVPMQ